MGLVKTAFKRNAFNYIPHKVSIVYRHICLHLSPLHITSICSGTHLKGRLSTPSWQPNRPNPSWNSCNLNVIHPLRWSLWTNLWHLQDLSSACINLFHTSSRWPCWAIRAHWLGPQSAPVVALLFFYLNCLGSWVKSGQSK